MDESTTEYVPLDAATSVVAVVKDGEIIRISIFSEQFEIADALEHFDPQPSFEAVKLVSEALKRSSELPPIELAVDETLTEEQKAIARKCAEESMDNCDFDDLYEAALEGSIDTPEKLHGWYKFAMDVQAEEDNDPRLRGEEL